MCWPRSTSTRRSSRPRFSSPRAVSWSRSGSRSSREALIGWARKWEGRLDAVAVEATTGWRWVARELQARGIEVRLTDPGQASALQGCCKRPKNDRLDARWLVMLLAREMLPEAWLAPEEIQRLRDKTRLRKALADDHTRWAQRLHALLVHEGWACSRGSLLTVSGRRWVAAIRLHPGARAQVEAMLDVMASLAHQIDVGLRAAAAGQVATSASRRCSASSGSGRSCHARSSPSRRRQRFRRARQVVRAAGLDPVVKDSAEKQRRGQLAKQGAPSCAGRCRGRPARSPPPQPRAPALSPSPRPRRREPSHALGRPQDRQARLPRPARTRDTGQPDRSGDPEGTGPRAGGPRPRRAPV